MQYYSQLLRMHVLRNLETNGSEPRVLPEVLVLREEWRVDREVATLSKIAQADSKQSLPDLLDTCLATRREIISLEEEEFGLLHGLGQADLAANPFKAFSPSIFVAIEAKNANSQQSTRQQFEQQVKNLRQQVRPSDTGGALWQVDLVKYERYLQQLLFLCQHAFRRFIVGLQQKAQGPDLQAEFNACDPYLAMCEHIRESRQRWIQWTQTQASAIPADRFQKALQTLTKIFQYRQRFNAQRLHYIQSLLAQRQNGDPAASLSDAVTAPVPSAAQVPPSHAISNSKAPIAALPNSAGSSLSSTPPSGQRPILAPATRGTGMGIRTPPATFSESSASSGITSSPSSERRFRGRRRLAAIRIQRWFRAMRYWRKAYRQWRTANRPNLTEVREFRRQLTARVSAAEVSRTSMAATGQTRQWQAAVLLQRVWRRVAARNMCSVTLWAVLTIQRFMRGYHVRRYQMRWVRAFHTLKVYRQQKINLNQMLEMGRRTAPALSELLEWHLNLSAEIQRAEGEIKKEEVTFETSWKSWEKQMMRHYLQSAPLDGDWVQKKNNADGRVYFLNVKTNQVSHQHPNMRLVEENRARNWPIALHKHQQRQATLNEYLDQLRTKAEGSRKEQGLHIHQMYLDAYDAKNP